MASGPKIRIFAPAISTYGRIAAMTATEAGLAWEIVLTPARTRENQQRHPFLKTPSAQIDGYNFFETIAICQYIDDVYGRGGLQPAQPLARARMSQWISIANAYLYPSTEYGLVMPRLVIPMMGGEVDEALIEKAIPQIAYEMSVVDLRLKGAPYLAGETYSLADIFMFCILRAVELTPEGRAILDRLPNLGRWLGETDARPSAAATRWEGETG